MGRHSMPPELWRLLLFENVQDKQMPKRGQNENEDEQDKQYRRMGRLKHRQFTNDNFGPRDPKFAKFGVHGVHSRMNGQDGNQFEKQMDTSQRDEKAELQLMKTVENGVVENQGIHPWIFGTVMAVTLGLL